MSMPTMNHRLQNDVVWFPQAGSVMLDCILGSSLPAKHRRSVKTGERLGKLLRAALSVSGKAFGVMGEAVHGYFRSRALRAHLLGLDERLLTDIGITRGDIEAIARGTYKPQPMATVHMFAQPATEAAQNVDVLAQPAVIEQHAA